MTEAEIMAIAMAVFAVVSIENDIECCSWIIGDP
jgi:hypothetical protein